MYIYLRSTRARAPLPPVHTCSVVLVCAVVELSARAGQLACMITWAHDLAVLSCWHTYWTCRRKNSSLRARSRHFYAGEGYIGAGVALESCRGICPLSVVLGRNVGETCQKSVCSEVFYFRKLLSFKRLQEKCKKMKKCSTVSIICPLCSSAGRAWHGYLIQPTKHNMITKTINAQTWDGQKVTFEHDDNTIKMHGYTFRIEKIPKIDDIPEFEGYSVINESGETFGISRWPGEPYMGITDTVVREGDDLHEVAAAMIANLY